MDLTEEKGPPNRKRPKAQVPYTLSLLSPLLGLSRISLSLSLSPLVRVPPVHACARRSSPTGDLRPPLPSSSTAAQCPCRPTCPCLR